MFILSTTELVLAEPYSTSGILPQPHPTAYIGGIIKYPNDNVQPLRAYRETFNIFTPEGWITTFTILKSDISRSTIQTGEDTVQVSDN